jgi:cellulose biosynthesis protein BcsQ
MQSIALFNHKGGVGKTTLAVNLAAGLVAKGKRVLIVDADPQCNISSFFLPESKLDEILGESGESDSAGTIWSAVRPVVEGTGDVADVPIYKVANTDGMLLMVGDVQLSAYEEELPAAWTDSFARKSRGYAVMGALRRAVNSHATRYNADMIIYDVGPNVGPLNRSIVLGCDGFITPVAPDLFSLRALSSVGAAIGKWIQDWRTVQMLATNEARRELLPAAPTYLGYIVSAFKAYGGAKSQPHEYWEAKIAPRVRSRIVDVLKKIDVDLVLHPPYKIGDVKHFQSLASIAQDKGLPIGWLAGSVNSGYTPEVVAAKQLFDSMAVNVIERINKACIAKESL